MITDGKNTLAGIFNDHILEVPTFQRAYAWSTSQLEAFIEDLNTHPQKSVRPYFFGTILLATSSKTPPPRYGVYAVVDGQQRLTTTCLFVAAAAVRLRASVEENSAVAFSERFSEEKGIRKFHTISEDDGFYSRLIKGDIVTLDDCDTPSKARLLSAYQYFLNTLQNIGEVETISLLNVLWSAQILVHTVTSNSEATQIFELQNDRGKKLTNLEALKSYLMHGIYTYGADTAETNLNIVQHEFSSIYRNLEKIESLIGGPSEDQLLAYHCIAFEEHQKIGDGLDGWSSPKKLVKVLLAKTSESDRLDWIKNFSHRLAKTYSSALQILEARNTYVLPQLGELTILDRLSTFFPLIIKCWSFKSLENKKHVETVIALMASFAFRSIVAGLRSGTGESQLERLARDFTGDFIQLTKTLSDMRGKWDIPKHYLIGLDSENFYSWGQTATYLLWKYENHLRKQPGRKTSSLEWDTVISPRSVAVRYAKDHIQAKNPQNPSLNRLVRWHKDDLESKPFSDIYLHRLGNLVLDTISTGSAKGSGDFQSRAQHYTLNTQFLSQGEIIATYAERDEKGDLHWGESSIKKRHEVLINFALTEI